MSSSDMDVHVKIVLEVENYEFLYNYKLKEYSRKDLTEKAWSEIANKIKISVNDCKEKWRNIRSTFSRSIKTKSSGSKPKKPYYLSEYLTFLLPYVKAINESQNCGNIPPTHEHDENSIDEDAVEEEQVPNSVPDNSQDIHQQPVSSPSPQVTPAGSSGSAPRILHGERRRKRTNNDIDAAMVKYLKQKTEKKAEPKENHPINHFFLSLLPEITDMTEQQIRTFKIRVLQLVDEIKQPEYLVYTPSSPSSTHNDIEHPYQYQGSSDEHRNRSNAHALALSDACSCSDSDIDVA